MLQELFGMLSRNYWQSWVEINPETAHDHGVSEGDLVQITSPIGSLEVEARLIPGIMPGVLYVPFGLGHKSNGRYAKGIGVNPYEILLEEFDHLSGTSSLTSTKATVEKRNRKEMT